MKKIQLNVFQFALIIAIFSSMGMLAGWSIIKNAPIVEVESFVEVEIIKVHRMGDDPTKSFWKDSFTHAIYERTDTHERRFSNKILGEVGDKLMEKVEYKNVQVGDTLFVGTEKVKKGESLKVTNVESWDTKSSYLLGKMYKVSLENGDAFFGWADRTLNKEI